MANGANPAHVDARSAERPRRRRTRDSLLFVASVPLVGSVLVANLLGLPDAKFGLLVATLTGLAVISKLYERRRRFRESILFEVARVLIAVPSMGVVFDAPFWTVVAITTMFASLAVAGNLFRWHTAGARLRGEGWTW